MKIKIQFFKNFMLKSKTYLDATGHQNDLFEFQTHLSEQKYSKLHSISLLYPAGLDHSTPSNKLNLLKVFQNALNTCM